MEFLEENNNNKEEYNWETCKENVRPVKSGRSAKGLGSFKGNKIDLNLQKQTYEDLIINTKNSEDPLDAYVKYFKWTRDTYPSDVSKTLELLERCTLALSHNDKYKNDIRFVKLWIEYADAVRTSGEIFSYMQSNKIGTKLSLFWIAWAFITEKLENYKLTDQIFQKGIKKNAEPKDILHKRYQQFQRRLARHYINLEEKRQQEEIARNTTGLSSSNNNVGSNSCNREGDGNSSRVVLGGLSRSRMQTASRSIQRQTAGRNQSGINNTNTNVGSSSSSSSSSSRNDHQGVGFEIFCDSSDPTYDHNDDLVGDGNVDWKILESDRNRRKENDGVKEEWHANRNNNQSDHVAMNNPFISKTTTNSTTNSSRNNNGVLGFEIFQDDPTEEPIDKASINIDGSSSITNVRLLDKPSSHPTTTAFSLKEREQQEEKKSSSSGNSKGMTKIEQIASNPLMRHKTTSSSSSSSSKGKSSSKSSNSKVKSDVPVTSIAVPHVTSSTTTTTTTTTNDVNMNAILTADAEDVTINTRIAMTDIDSMFCSPDASLNITTTNNTNANTNTGMSRGVNNFNNNFNNCSSNAHNIGIVRQLESSSLNDLSEIREITANISISSDNQHNVDVSVDGPTTTAIPTNSTGPLFSIYSDN